MDSALTTKIVYMDECGDDGLKPGASDIFVLTSMCISACDWRKAFDAIKANRTKLKQSYNFPVKTEIHTKELLLGKNPYHPFGWSPDTRREIVRDILSVFADIDVSLTAVIIDKSAIIKRDSYNVLGTALKYNIQRLENTSGGEWNYIIVTDEGRIGAMRAAAREICAFNPIPNHEEYGDGYRDLPNKYLVEDILDKDSKESYFIQLCDFVSCFVHLYFMNCVKGKDIPKRMQDVISCKTIIFVLDQLHKMGRLNLKASNAEYGLVIYPKRK